MKICRISKDVVLRRYGNILLGYFISDPRMRYFTIEGIALQVIDALYEEKTDKMLKTEFEERGITEREFQIELNKLVTLSIVEVTEYDKSE